MRKRRNWLVLAGFAALSACSTSSAWLRDGEAYQALGHDPGLLLTIESNRLKFVTSSPKTLIEVPRPILYTSPLGRRYLAGRLTLDIAPRPCTDERSGIAFADTVLIVLDGYSYRGCGGRRVPLLDI